MHIEDGEELPDTCIPPDLNPALVRYKKAFDALTFDRPQAMGGVSYIPTLAIIGYAKEMEGLTDRDELRFYNRMVRAIDREWVKATLEANPQTRNGD